MDADSCALSAALSCVDYVSGGYSGPQMEWSTRSWDGKGGNNPLTVVYWSRDWGEHVMGRLTQGLMEVHGHTSGFQLVCASFGNDHDHAKEGVVRSKVRAAANVFLELPATASAARDIHHCDPFILVDLMGHTTGRIISVPGQKPAPIIINYLGYPGTVGGPFVDYAIVDRIVTPPDTSPSNWSEKLIYLPWTYQTNALPLHSKACLTEKCIWDERVRSVIPFVFSIEDQGGLITPNSTLFCNYNKVDKLDPEGLTLMLNVMRRVPGSLLILLSAGNGEKGRKFEHRLREEVALRGIHPGRLILQPRVAYEDHLQRVSAYDVILDGGLLYGSHTTATDALWGGVPLVTLEGASMHVRVGSSLLNALGLRDLAVSTGVKDMEDLAVQLVEGGKQSLAYKLRRRILQNSLEWPLFDTQRTAQALRFSYEAVRDIYGEEMTPQHLIVGDYHSSTVSGVRGGSGRWEMAKSQQAMTVKGEGMISMRMSWARPYEFALLQKNKLALSFHSDYYGDSENV